VEVCMFDESHAAMNGLAGCHGHERQMATNRQSLLVGLVDDCTSTIAAKTSGGKSLERILTKSAPMAFSLSTAARADAGSVTEIDPGHSGFGPSTLGPVGDFGTPLEYGFRDVSTHFANASDSISKEYWKPSLVVRDQIGAATKMSVHVPEAGNHVFSTRIDDPSPLRQLRFGELANGLNAIADNNDGAVWQRWLTGCVDDGHMRERKRVSRRREQV
jgi:hypothetical protein